MQVHVRPARRRRRREDPKRFELAAVDGLPLVRQQIDVVHELLGAAVAGRIRRRDRRDEARGSDRATRDGLWREAIDGGRRGRVLEQECRISCANRRAHAVHRRAADRSRDRLHLDEVALGLLDVGTCRPFAARGHATGASRGVRRGPGGSGSVRLSPARRAQCRTRRERADRDQRDRVHERSHSATVAPTCPGYFFWFARVRGAHTTRTSAIREKTPHDRRATVTLRLLSSAKEVCHDIDPGVR